MSGLPRVTAVAPCPEMKPGSGRIVLMKSTTRYTGEMAKLTLAGVAVPLEGTSGHPIFSEDRGDYVSMGELVPGERVPTADGWATVESLGRTWTTGTTVYNLEVEGEHRFLAGFGRVVSHNAGPGKGCGPNTNNCPGNAGTQRAKNIAKGIPPNQLGPSGKPKFHVVEKPTMKAAEDAARNAGGSAPIKHTQDRGQPSHYHPTDRNGNKLTGKDNVHYQRRGDLPNPE